MKKTIKTYLVYGLVACFALPATAMAESAMTTNQPAATQQAKLVRGHVVDENGDPMIGVTVKIVGATGGAVTDLNGDFSLNVPAGRKLAFSYAGYKEQTADASTGMTVRMDPDVMGLDEVVVVGYGTVKKRDLTGAVTSMKNEDVTISPTNDIMEALEGKIAGFDITKESGEIGAGVNLLLRGSRSIYGDNRPLFIIDGLPGSYEAVNPNDIESIDVLKDASATAIYGSAGANGVVIITTKRGAAGKVKVNFDAYFGWSGDPEFKHGMTGDEWTNYYREAYKYKNGSYPDNIIALMNGNQEYADAYNEGKWIDWVSEAMNRKATTQKYSLSVTAGNDKTKIFASAVYTQDKGLLSNEQRDKYALRLNIDQQIFDWAKIGFTSNLNYSIHDRGDNKTFTRALEAFPLGSVRDEYGELNHEYISNQYSPLSDFIENQYSRNTRSTYINAIGYLELTPLAGLSIRSQVNGTLSHSRLGQYWGVNSNALRPTYAGSPHAGLTYNDDYGYTWENIISYNKTIANDHSFGITAVSSWQKNTSEMGLASGSNQDLDVWQYWRLMSATAPHVESEYAKTQKMSYAVRFNYAYKGKYMFTFSNRWDGVSFFSEGKKWDSFPAGALAWRISDEKFMDFSKGWLDNLKLRVGAGITGNSGGVGAYSTQTNAYAYSASGITIDGKIVPFTQYTGTYGSPDLTWEKSYNWNFGLDFTVLGGRIDGSIEYYTTVTRGLLFKRTMPITSGITGWGSPLSSWENVAKTSNKGLEVTINSRNIVTKDFKWNTTLTATWQKEKIESLPDGDLVNEKLFVGEAIKSIYDYKYAGIWGTDATQEELDTYGVKPGWVKIETVPVVNEDGTTDEGKHKYSEKQDRQVLGHLNPNWILGLNNTFTYKNFDLTVYCMARLGQTITSNLMGFYTAKSSITTNQLSGVDYWTETNQGAYYPAPGSGDDQSIGISALRVFDGSFFKVKNITLGYTLPKSITKHALIERCRFYFTAYNPWIICKESQLKGTDPEMNGSDRFPTYKQYVFGVNITF